MKTPPPYYGATLGRLQPSSTDLEAVKAQGWRAQRILVIACDDPRLDWHERQWVQRLGERLYGARAPGGTGHA